MPVAEILSQGDEVVTGQVADTNAAWLSTQLTDLGFAVRRHSVVGDRLPDLIGALQAISNRSDVCIGTGGLGPTEDDLTAEAVAQAFHRPLVFDEAAMAQIEARFAAFGRRMPESNRKQAWLPTGATRIDNPWGTAPGFAVSEGRCWMVFLPGVPREMRQLYEAWVLPALSERFQLAPWRLITLRTTGVGESTLQERLQGLQLGAIVLGYRTKLPENHVKLRVPPSVGAPQVLQVVTEAVRRIGRPLFTVEGAPFPLPGIDTSGGSLAEVLGRMLVQREATLAVAESCTGGRASALCTANPGSSRWFLEGAVTYSNEAKVRALGVDPGTLAEHGAVSEVVARQMAEGIRRRSGATYGLSVTGIAGPTGASPSKPVGTVHLAVASPEGDLHRRVQIPGDRVRIQSLSAAGVLDLLRRHLHTPTLPPTPEQNS